MSYLSSKALMTPYFMVFPSVVMQNEKGKELFRGDFVPST